MTRRVVGSKMRFSSTSPLQKLLGEVNYYTNPTFGQREADNDFWRDDQTVFKWQQFPAAAAAANRSAAVARLHNFKTLNLTPGAFSQTTCTQHSADGDAPLTASDLTYTCPNGAFFNRFVTVPGNTNNTLAIRCCKLASGAPPHGSCDVATPFFNRREEYNLGCRSSDERSVAGITFAGASTEITSVRCCKQAALDAPSQLPLDKSS